MGKTDTLDATNYRDNTLKKFLSIGTTLAKLGRQNRKTKIIIDSIQVRAHGERLTTGAKAEAEEEAETWLLEPHRPTYTFPMTGAAQLLYNVTLRPDLSRAPI